MASGGFQGGFNRFHATSGGCRKLIGLEVFFINVYFHLKIILHLGYKVISRAFQWISEGVFKGFHEALEGFRNFRGVSRQF